MTEEEAEALIKRHLDNPNKYDGKLTPEEEARATAAWVNDVREGTKPIPDARSMLDGDEFLDADEARELLNRVYLDLTAAGFQRHDETTPLKVEPEVVERLQRGLELLDQFEDDQTGGKPGTTTAVEVEERSKHPWGDDDPDAPLSPAKIADRLGIPPADDKRRDALRQRLGKWRRENPKGGWIEDEQGGGRKVKYSYPIGKVWPVVEDMKRSG
jgi:hypothetical protein